MVNDGTSEPREFVLRIENIRKSFGNDPVLNGIDLRIPCGKTTVIVGSSGHGKSTLLKILIGALEPDSGRVFCSGLCLNDMTEIQWDAFRIRFGTVFQGAALFNSLTVAENIALPLQEHSKLSESVVEKIVKIKLELVGLRGFETMMPEALSGGMRKRVAIARAIALDPELVFYDEPTSGLDPITAAVMDRLIQDLTQKLGITSVIISHDMTSAFHIADHMAMLYRGKIIIEGEPEKFRTSDDPRVQQFIHGWPDGPIPMSQSKGNYFEDLFGFDPMEMVKKQ